MKNRTTFLMLWFLTVGTVSYGQEEQEFKHLNSSGSTNLNLGSLDFTVTVGGGASYVVPSVSKDWADYDQGVGVLWLYNWSPSVMVKIKERIGLSLTAVVSSGGVYKRYVTEGVEQYTSKYTLNSTPIILGGRFYVNKYIYVEPGIGVSLLNLAVKTSENHPLGQYSLDEKSTKPLANLSVGYDYRIGKIALEFSGYATITGNKESFGLIHPLLFTGIRAGIGFASK